MSKLSISFISCGAVLLIALAVVIPMRSRGDQNTQLSEQPAAGHDENSNVPPPPQVDKEPSKLLTKVANHTSFPFLAPYEAFPSDDDSLTGDDFLARFSPSYLGAQNQIASDTKSIQDDSLREAAQKQAWAKLDRSSFIAEAHQKYLADRAEFLRDNKDKWFEIGHCEYDPSSQLITLIDTAASPIVAGLQLPVPIDEMDRIWRQFGEASQSEYAAELNQRTSTLKRALDDYVKGGGQEPSNIIENINKNLEAAPSETAQHVREQRLIAVAEEDLLNKKIDRVLLIDYDSEKVFGSFPATALQPFHPIWKIDKLFTPTDGSGKN